MHSGKGEETRPFNCSNLPKWLSLIHKALGLHKNQQLVGSAAAPLSVDTILYFQSLDIMIGEFYGSTETAGPQTSSMEGKSTKIFEILMYTQKRHIEKRLFNMPKNPNLGCNPDFEYVSFLNYHKWEYLSHFRHLD